MASWGCGRHFESESSSPFFLPFCFSVQFFSLDSSLRHAQPFIHFCTLASMHCNHIHDFCHSRMTGFSNSFLLALFSPSCFPVSLFGFRSAFIRPHHRFSISSDHFPHHGNYDGWNCMCLRFGLLVLFADSFSFPFSDQFSTQRKPLSTNFQRPFFQPSFLWACTIWDYSCVVFVMMHSGCFCVLAIIPNSSSDLGAGFPVIFSSSTFHCSFFPSSCLSFSCTVLVLPFICLYVCSPFLFFSHFFYLAHVQWFCHRFSAEGFEANNDDDGNTNGWLTQQQSQQQHQPEQQLHSHSQPSSASPHPHPVMCVWMMALNSLTVHHHPHPHRQPRQLHPSTTTCHYPHTWMLMFPLSDFVGLLAYAFVPQAAIHSLIHLLRMMIILQPRMCHPHWLHHPHQLHSRHLLLHFHTIHHIIINSNINNITLHYHHRSFILHASAIESPSSSSSSSSSSSLYSSSLTCHHPLPFTLKPWSIPSSSATTTVAPLAVQPLLHILISIIIISLSCASSQCDPYRWRNDIRHQMKARSAGDADAVVGGGDDDAAVCGAGDDVMVFWHLQPFFPPCLSSFSFIHPFLQALILSLVQTSIWPWCDIMNKTTLHAQTSQTQQQPQQHHHQHHHHHDHRVHSPHLSHLPPLLILILIFLVEPLPHSNCVQPCALWSFPSVSHPRSARVFMSSQSALLQFDWSEAKRLSSPSAPAAVPVGSIPVVWRMSIILFEHELAVPSHLCWHLNDIDHDDCGSWVELFLRACVRVSSCNWSDPNGRFIIIKCIIMTNSKLVCHWKSRLAGQLVCDSEQSVASTTNTTRSHCQAGRKTDKNRGMDRWWGWMNERQLSSAKTESQKDDEGRVKGSDWTVVWPAAERKADGDHDAMMMPLKVLQMRPRRSVVLANLSLRLSEKLRIGMRLRLCLKTMMTRVTELGVESGWWAWWWRSVNIHIHTHVLLGHSTCSAFTWTGVNLSYWYWEPLTRGFWVPSSLSWLCSLLSS